MTKPENLYIIGLTGGIACGKSTASSYLASIGAQIFDADEVSRNLTARNGIALPQIQKIFGDEVFLQDGTLNRHLLGEKIFTNPDRKKMLEDVLHPLIYDAMHQKFEEVIAQGYKIIVIDVPLLYERGLYKICDEVWVMALSMKDQISRLVSRGLTEQEATNRIFNQIPIRLKIAMADHTLYTDQDVEVVREELKTLWENTNEKLRSK